MSEERLDLDALYALCDMYVNPDTNMFHHAGSKYPAAFTYEEMKYIQGALPRLIAEHRALLLKFAPYAIQELGEALKGIEKDLK